MQFLGPVFDKKKKLTKRKYFTRSGDVGIFQNKTNPFFIPHSSRCHVFGFFHAITTFLCSFSTITPGLTIYEEFNLLFNQSFRVLEVQFKDFFAKIINQDRFQVSVLE